MARAAATPNNRGIKVMSKQAGPEAAAWQIWMPGADRNYAAAAKVTAVLIKRYRIVLTERRRYITR
jgi:hypothetical protein